MVPTGSISTVLPEEGEGGCGNAKGSGTAEGSMVEEEKMLGLQEGADERETEIKVPKKKKKKGLPNSIGTRPRKEQVLGTCAKCGYLSSQTHCKACTLLEGLNKGRPKVAIAMEDGT